MSRVRQRSSSGSQDGNRDALNTSSSSSSSNSSVSSLPPCATKSNSSQVQYLIWRLPSLSTMISLSLDNSLYSIIWTTEHCILVLVKMVAICLLFFTSAHNAFYIPSHYYPNSTLFVSCLHLSSLPNQVMLTVSEDLFVTKVSHIYMSKMGCNHVQNT